tara:strand:- start:185 stop:1030 length:846 start_codon:yes stop_codon:yes gene_type:complete
MILVDLNQVMISNLMAQSKGNLTELPSKDTVRHSILNTIRAFNVKFKEEYGEMILCADAADPWRRDIFPNYKHQRRVGRVESKIDWDGLFKIMSDIREEFINKLPYKVLHVDKCEADDIIGTLCAQQTEDLYLIISGDKDFIQLQHYGNVYQFSPLLKSFIGEQLDATVFLREQIIKGDRSDGVPNILSDDDIFLRDERQKPINKKRLEEWSNVDNIPLGSETRKYYDRNKKLIDLSMIPQNITESIINRYKDYKVNDRSQLLQYFIDNKLKALIENINDF